VSNVKFKNDHTAAHPHVLMLKNWEESAMPHATIFEQEVSFKQRKNTQAVGNMWQKWRSSLLLQHMWCK
jgi:hypothetical protein